MLLDRMLILVGVYHTRMCPNNAKDVQYIVINQIVAK
jgi:hypothetical protein